MIVSPRMFERKSETHPEYSHLEIDVYGHLPDEAVQSLSPLQRARVDHRLTIRFNFGSSRFEIFKHYLGSRVDEVCYTYPRLEDAVRTASQVYRALYSEDLPVEVREDPLLPLCSDALNCTYNGPATFCARATKAKFGNCPYPTIPAVQEISSSDDPQEDPLKCPGESECNESHPCAECSLRRTK